MPSLPSTFCLSMCLLIRQGLFYSVLIHESVYFRQANVGNVALPFYTFQTPQEKDWALHRWCERTGIPRSAL